jgi:hypothetical protein
MEKRQKIVSIIPVLLIALLLNSPYFSASQDLSTVTSQQPMLLHGTTGASFTFNRSNESSDIPAPVEWNLFGNYKMQVYGIELPFSFVINRYSESWSHPFTQFGITPTYKWVKFHAGYSSMQLSPLSSYGHTFNGAGLELTPKKLRFSAFYGQLSVTGNDAPDGMMTTPSYSGTGYGAKLGLGDSTWYFDVSYFHAKGTGASPTENTVAGADFKVKILKVASLMTNFAVSRTTRKQPDEVNHPDLSAGIPWALESVFALDLKNFMMVISYRNVQDGFTMFGDQSPLTNGQVISLLNAASLAKGTINVNSTVAWQSSNLQTGYSGDISIQARKGDKTITGEVNFFTFRENMNLYEQDNHNSNITASLTYNLQVTENSVSLSFNTAYNHFNQYGTSGSSLGGTVETEARLLKDKNLVLGSSAGYVYFNNRPGESKGNLLLSCKAAWQVNNSTTFNFFVDYRVTPVYRMNNPAEYMTNRTTTNTLSVGISLTKSF